MRNSGKNTRRITAATLAMALAIAVYLNWEYARTGTGLQTADSSAAAAAASIGGVTEAAAEPTAADASAIQVSDALQTESEALQAADKNYGEAQLVSISKDSGSAFFEQARLDRTKSRDEAVDQIEKSLKKAALSADEKKTLTEQLTACLEDITAENEIETLVNAKGMADCLCFLQDGRANLTVMTSGGDGLNASQVAQIRDIVLSKCSGMSAQDITVVEVK